MLNQELFISFASSADQLWLHRPLTGINAPFGTSIERQGRKPSKPETTKYTNNFEARGIEHVSSVFRAQVKLQLLHSLALTELPTCMSFEDLAVDSQTKPFLIQLTLKKSKTDTFPKGVQVVQAIIYAQLRQLWHIW